MYILYIGAIYTADMADAERVLPMPDAPRNYKDEAKIAAYIAERREIQLAEAPLNPLVGKLKSVSIRSSTGESLHEFNDPKDAGTKLLEAIRKYAHDDSEGYHDSYDWGGVIVGLDIQRILQYAALNIVDTKGNLSDWAIFALQNLSSNFAGRSRNEMPVCGVIDPVDALFSKTQFSSDVAPADALRRLGRGDLVDEFGTADGLSNVAFVLGGILGLNEGLNEDS